MRNKEEREADRERKNQTFTQFTILCEGGLRVETGIIVTGNRDL